MCMENRNSDIYVNKWVAEWGWIEWLQEGLSVLVKEFQGKVKNVHNVEIMELQRLKEIRNHL